jgi:hypothetical protein
MDIDQIKRMIRNSVKRQITELSKLTLSPPKNFGAFRCTLSEALRHAGAPDEMSLALVESAGEGSGLFEVSWEAWKNIDAELKSTTSPVERQQVWSEAIEYYVHAAVIDLVAEYRSPVNESRTPLRLSDEKLASRVVSVLKGEKVAALKKVPTTIVEMINAIDQELSGIGAWIKCYPAPTKDTKSVQCTVVLERGVPAKTKRVIDEVMSRDLGFTSSFERLETKQPAIVEYEASHAIVSLEPAGPREIKLSIYLKA